MPLLLRALKEKPAAALDNLDLAAAHDKPLGADARMALIAGLAEHVGRPVDRIDLARAWSTA